MVVMIVVIKIDEVFDFGEFFNKIYVSVVCKC